MKCFVLSSIISIVTCEIFDYCKYEKKHPFCLNDCLRYPVFEDSSDRFEVSKYHIQRMTDDYNRLRTKVARGELWYNFWNSECYYRSGCQIPRAHLMNEVAS